MTINDIQHDHCPYVCRMSRNDVLVLSNRFALPQNEVFIFYASCFKAKAQRFLEPAFGISDSHISNIFCRILKSLVNNYVNM